MRVAYLDTNHLSNLARFPDRDDVQGIHRLLSGGDLALGISMLHVQELSDPGFVSRPAVGALLDSVPVMYAPTFTRIWDLETEAAFRWATSGDRPNITAFFPRFSEAAGAGTDVDIPPSRMLEAMAANPDLRSKLPAAAAYGARGDAQFKRQAAIVRHPSLPPRLRLESLQRSRTPGGLYLPRPMSGDEILERIGGIAGLPGYHVQLGLARQRLNDPRFVIEPNDLMDEWHATHVPYVAAAALDRRTAARYRSAGLPFAERVTHELAEIPGILARS